MEHVSHDKIIIERFDRTDQHLKIMKASIELITDNSNRISHALIGNEFTGGFGLIHKVKKIDEDVQNIKDDLSLLKDNMFLVKWVGGTIFASVVAMVLYILQAKI